MAIGGATAGCGDGDAAGNGDATARGLRSAGLRAAG
jgi:hypothetical protein